MVAFLKKPQGSEDFHQIVDFLNPSHIRYALIENLTINDSLINKFWRTASARTLDNREIELNATVDGQDKTITEAYVRRHLKLADANDKAITKEMHDGLGRATTTASSLEVEQGSDKVTALENELKSTKAVYNKALITLIKRVKKLEKKLKYKRRRAVVDSLEDEETSLDKEDSPKQRRMIEEINEDEDVNLVKSRGYTLKQLKQYSFKEIKMLFDRTMESKRKFVPMESEGQIADSNARERISKEGESLKRHVKEELGQEHQKKQKGKEDLSQERLQQMMVIILEQGIHVEALQTKENLVKLLSLVKERCSSSNLTEEKEIALWNELKRLFEPDDDDELWKFKSFELI
nr:hypothetical protein [Tanacetum cinerariifolium]